MFYGHGRLEAMLRLLQRQRQQIVGLSSISDRLNVLGIYVVVDMYPRALYLGIAIRAPHRVITVFFDVAYHLLARGKPALQSLPRLIDLIPPQVTDVFMPWATCHTA